jgi:hypothetical protein
MKRTIRAILAAFLIVIGVGTFDEVRADPLALSSFKDSEWRVDFSPYVFFPVSVDGDSTVSGQTISLDLDASDILDLLDFALAGRLEAWKGDFGLILDGYYVNLDAGGTVGTPGPLPINVSIDADIRQFYLDALGSYRVINQPYNADGDMWSLDLMGGLRYNYLRQVVDLTVSGGPGGGEGPHRWAVASIGSTRWWGREWRWC